LNGRTLDFQPADAIRAMLALAAGETSEEELAAWFRERIAG
jgi:death-on-curing protein